MCQTDCLLRDALCGLPVGLILLDAQGKVAWLNRAAEFLLGTSASECLHHSFARVLRDPQWSIFWLNQQATDDVAPVQLTVHYPRAMELKVFIANCWLGDGELPGRALLICDVTEQCNAQVELSRAVAERLLALTSGHMPPEPVAGLTSQELRVLRLVGRGLSNEDVAQRMSISVATVRSHLKRLYRKLRLRSRAEAVSFATRHHLA